MGDNEERFAPFQCPVCSAKFCVERGDESWDEELRYDIATWLVCCTDQDAINRAAPGRCRHLQSQFRHVG